MPAFAALRRLSVVGIVLVTRKSGAVTYWHPDDVRTLLAVVPALDDELTPPMLAALWLLSSVLADADLWTGPSDELAEVREMLGDAYIRLRRLGAGTAY